MDYEKNSRFSLGSLATAGMLGAFVVTLLIPNFWPAKTASQTLDFSSRVETGGTNAPQPGVNEQHKTNWDTNSVPASPGNMAGSLSGFAGNTPPLQPK